MAPEIPPMKANVRTTNISSYAEVFASLSETEAARWVDWAYRLMLGRAVDAPVLDARIGQLREHGLQSVLVDLAESEECWRECGGESGRVYIAFIWYALTGAHHGLAVDDFLAKTDLSQAESRRAFAIEAFTDPAVRLRHAQDLWCGLIGDFQALASGSLHSWPDDAETILSTELSKQARAGGTSVDTALEHLVRSVFQTFLDRPPSDEEALGAITVLSQRASLGGFIAFVHQVLDRKDVIARIRTLLQPVCKSRGWTLDTDMRLETYGFLKAPLGTYRDDAFITIEGAVEVCRPLMGPAVSEALVYRCAAKLVETLDVRAVLIEAAITHAAAIDVFRLLPSNYPELSQVVGHHFGRAAPAGGPGDSAFGTPTIATTFFYWYDVKYGRTYLEDPDQAGHSEGFQLSHTPVRIEELTYWNYGFHERELVDQLEAGVDVTLPVYFGSPYSAPEITKHGDEEGFSRASKFSDIGLQRVLVAARRVSQNLNRPIRLGMFYDTSSLNTDNAKRWHVNAQSRAGRAWFYETIRQYFSQVPPDYRATIDGRPVIFVYHPSFAARLDRRLYAEVYERFEADFGVRPFIVTAAEEDAVLVTDPAAATTWANQATEGGATKTLSDILGSQEAFNAIGASGEEEAVVLQYRLLTDTAPTADILEHLNRHAALIGRGPALLLLPEVIKGVLAGLARRWFRAEHDDTLTAWPELAEAATAAQNGDLLDGFAVMLASDRFYAAAGGQDTFFLDHLARQFSLRFSRRDRREADLATIRTSGRRALVQAYIRETEALQGLVSDWAFRYLGRFNPGASDMEFYWSGAIEPMFYNTPSIGPGYDQSALKARPTLVSPRDDGRRYTSVWETLLSMQPRPWLVHLETWNELFEGSQLCETEDFGRLYIEMTRRYADLFHAGTVLNSATLAETDFHALSPVLKG